MAEVAAIRDSGLWPVVKKRWRGWLRAFHRDFGYLAIGFTVIYAVSGIAQNHIEDWGDVSYKTYERTIQIPEIPVDVSDDAAIKQVAAVAHLGKPIATFRAGDEIRLEYANGDKVTAIGTDVTIQGRERRAFIGAANWVHTARNRNGWKYVADVYAVCLIALAISGIFMIKGKLGLKGRGAFLISAGVAVPIAAVLFSSPSGTKTAPTTAQQSEAAPSESGIKYLPPEPDEAAPTKPDEPIVDDSTATPDGAKPKCDPFGSMHGCAPPKADKPEKFERPPVRKQPPPARPPVLKEPPVN